MSGNFNLKGFSVKFGETLCRNFKTLLKAPVLSCGSFQNPPNQAIFKIKQKIYSYSYSDSFPFGFKKTHIYYYLFSSSFFVKNFEEEI